MEELIGFFVNTLPLRVDLSGAPTVAELLERVKARALEAQQNQDIPFEQVVELVQPARSLAHTPLFQVMFAWQNAPGGSLELPGLAVRDAGAAETRRPPSSTSTLTLWEDGGRIVGAWSTRPRSSSVRPSERFVELPAARARGDGAGRCRAQWSGIALLSAAERARWWRSGARTTRRFRPAQCIHELFEAQAARTPDAAALVLRGRAAHLRGAERPGQPAGAPPRGGWAWSADARGGRVPGVGPGAGGRRCWPCSRRAAPTCRWTRRFPPSGWRYMLEDAGVAPLVTRAALADRVPAGLRRCGWMSTRGRGLPPRRPRPRARGVSPGGPGVRDLHVRLHRPAEGRGGGARRRGRAPRLRGAGARDRAAETGCCSSPRSASTSRWSRCSCRCSPARRWCCAARSCGAPPEFAGAGACPGDHRRQPAARVLAGGARPGRPGTRWRASGFC